MKKKIILINYLLAPLGRMNQSLLQQGAMLREAKNAGYQLVFLSANKTKKGLHKFCEESLIGTDEIEILSWKSIYDALFSNAEKFPKNWNAAIATITEHIFCKLEEEHGWDGNSSNLTQFLFGGVLAKSLTTEKMLTEQLETNNGMGFGSTRNNILKGLLSLNLIKKYGICTKHLIFDPCEVQYDSLLNGKELYKKYHGYNSKFQNFKRCDSLQYYLLQKFGYNYYNTQTDFNTRDLDFVFGATVLAKSRLWIDEIISDLKSNLNTQTSRIYYTNKYLKIDEFINRETYLSLIARAKYTLIVRSYDLNSFSTYRVIESVFRGCVPFLHINSNWQILSESFAGLEENWLRDTLVVSSTEEIKNKMQSFEEMRKEICDRLYSCLFENLKLPEF